ncbi:exo-alpha-sialidase [Trypanosoma cruzi]|nr:exo-alpha-sialidase [Trypanosoma cruzi]
MEEQCTGNTQRRSPPEEAAGATAGALLFVTRQQTLNNVHTQSNQREAKGHSRTSQHSCAAASHLATVSSNAHAHHSTQPENPSSTKPRRERHVGRYSCWGKVDIHSSQTSSTPHHSIAARRQNNNRITSTRQIAGSRPPSSQEQPQTKYCACVRSQRPRHSTACETKKFCAFVRVFFKAYTCGAALRYERV